MASGVNKVILIGNLGSDPEVRHLNTGSVVANFSIATSESYTNRNGERVTQTEWHRIELWDNLAKIAEQYLKKGQTIYLEGKLRTESWTDNEGNNRSTTRIRGLNMTMLGGRPDTSQAGAVAPPPAESAPTPSAGVPPQQQAPQAIPDAIKNENEDDDLPF